MNTISLSRFTENHTGDPVDCLIIGGGITGAALAYEAASRGFSTALVEKDDFGGATSAATGKLIHGGLRYLKQLEVGLVRESLMERRILSNIAPNLVYPFPIILPDAGFVVKLGLFAYDLLSLDRNLVWDKSKRIPGFCRLTAKQVVAAMPKSATKPAGRAIRYYDCLCLSPERLTLAFIKSAAAQGAKVANYAKTQSLIIEKNRVLGATVQDRITGKTMEVIAKVTINATGPWTQTLLNRTKETRTPMPEMRSEGIYLVTRKLTDQMFLYVGEHGHFSFSPWRNHSLIGPTDTPYYGEVDDWQVTQKSVDDFLEVINQAAGLRDKLTRKDVKFAYGGLRPLAETASNNTYTASRRSALHDHEDDGISGLISAAGGKYTTSRRFARQIFDCVAKKSERPATPSISHRRHLYGCDIPGIEAFIARKKQDLPAVSEQTLDYLIRHYGREFEAVLDLARTSEGLGKAVNADGEIMAQVLFAVKNELARSLTDIFFRRTGMGWLGHPGAAIIETAATIAAAELDWSKEKKELEIKELNQKFLYRQA
ncbi:MAG: glycerol-3-phosphate dehydrogenase/oxidase [Proteobacteria bacterium]|nr:glycerol-3-phosphate dehydrogenase/oxidase [Pseudomonadota bacterium]